jgi:hypothetical protein
LKFPRLKKLMLFFYPNLIRCGAQKWGSTNTVL